MANITASQKSSFALDGAASTAMQIPWLPIIATMAVLYPVLCSYLRFKRRDAMQKKFGYSTRESLSEMTNDDAQKIVAFLGDSEFPTIYENSLKFALFKTYGIPTISKLLKATAQLGSAMNASKRFADTGLLIQEFTGHSPTSERTLQAISRMNYIHSAYQRSGRISNDDLLYTLSVFITEPPSWIGRMEWRELTPMEICAIATFWKAIGDAMNISYEPLKRQTWKDGLEFFDDIKDWAEAYEVTYMVPTASNNQVANETVAILLFHLPKSWKGMGAKVVASVMPDRLRTAMVFEKPAASYFTFTNTAIALRRFVMRYLALPRLWPVKRFTEADSQTGRYHLINYDAHPFYVKPGLINRWGPTAWMVWYLGADLPGDKGASFQPEGYEFVEVGPKAMRGKGKQEMEKIVDGLMVHHTGGCPFALSRR